MKKLIIITASVIALGLTSCSATSKSVITNDSSSITEESTDTSLTNHTETTNSKTNLYSLDFDLPNSITKKGNEAEIQLFDKNNQLCGGIDKVGYDGTYMSSLPNHSDIVTSEDIHTNIGTGKLFTLECSEPATLSNSTTWNEVYAIIPDHDSKVAYDIWIKGTKDNLMVILNSIHESKDK